jgi:hypothetical protein
MAKGKAKAAKAAAKFKKTKSDARSEQVGLTGLAVAYVQPYQHADSDHRLCDSAANHPTLHRTG